jgi:hypothetical protein
MKNRILAVLCLLIAASAFAASRYRVDELTSEGGGPVSLSGGATVPAQGVLTVAGPATLSGATTISGTTTLSGAVNASGGLTVPTSGATGKVYSSSAALVLTAGTNVAAVVTPTTAQFTRVGNVVRAWGLASIDPTSDDTSTVFTLSLPVTIATNFASAIEGFGYAAKISMESGICVATASAKTITCTYLSNGTAVELVGYSFEYLVN